MKEINSRSINNISLYNLAQRIKHNKALLKRFPEQKDMLERKIKEAELMIIEMLERNGENELLKKIY